MSAYGKLCTAFYDADKPAAPPDAVVFYLAAARRADGPVLEPMCGSGRFLLPLLQAGIDIDGVDMSDAMLAACRARAAALGLVAGVHAQSLAALALPRRYAMAFIPAGSLGLIHRPDDLRASLARLRHHLLPGAMLYAELVDPDGESGEDNFGASRAVTTAAGQTLCFDYRATTDREARTVRYDGRYALRDGDRVLAEEAESIVLRLYTSAELVAALRDAGFRDVHVLRPETGCAWLDEGGCLLHAATVPSA